MGMATTIRVREDTLELLKQLKADLRIESYDAALRKLLEQRARVPRTMLGANPKLKPFAHEPEFHGD